MTWFWIAMAALVVLSAMLTWSRAGRAFQMALTVRDSRIRAERALNMRMDWELAARKKLEKRLAQAETKIRRLQSQNRKSENL